MTRYLLQHRTTSAPTYLHRVSRPEGGRMAWRGWLNARWTLDPQAAKSWATQAGAEAFRDRHSVEADAVEAPQ